MSSHGKLTLRPRSHLDFVLGWPGIPGSSNTSRSPAHIAGFIEARMSGKGVRAKWLRIELRKIETVPGGEHWGELIGTGPTEVWSAASSTTRGADRETDGDGAVWEVIKSQDFAFKIPIPEALPPTAKLDKNIGIAYEVVSSLCIKTKKGLINKQDVTSVIQTVQAINLDKHELHSTWPAYNQPDTHAAERDQLRAKLRRERYAFAPGDKVRFKVIVSSNRVEPAKLKSVAVTIKETVTFHGVKPSKKTLTSNNPSAKPSMQRVTIIAQKSKSVGKKMYSGDSKDFELECIIPKSHALMSISTGKHVEVSYTMRVYVDISKAPIVIDHIPMMMTTFPRAYSLEIMKKIGFVEGLSEREMLIDDDVDDDVSVQNGVSRMVRPARRRSVSYNDSLSSGTLRRQSYGGSTYLGRRDTVMTQSTVGPGMAGRGVPGQLFSSFGPGYPPGTMMDANQNPVRPAFAGPNDNGEVNLSAAERAAMFHHSYAPDTARQAGVEYEDYAVTDTYMPQPVRGSAIREDEEYDGTQSGHSFASYPTQQPPSRPQTASEAAEMEKERLYQRARQQAERNQRRAVYAQSAAQAGAGSSSQLSSQRHRSMDPTGRSISNGNTPTPQSQSEEEKMRLWDRARREAEAYQRGYIEGATFPANDDASMPRRPMSVQPQSPQSRQRSDGYAPGSPQVQSSSRQPQRMSALPASTSFQSAEAEKKRLYEQARAQTDAHLMARRTSAGESISGSSLSDHSNVSSAAGPSVFAGLRSPQMGDGSSAVGEKEQMRRYYAAQNEVQQHQSQLDGGGGSGSRATGSGTAAGASGSASQADNVLAPAPTHVGGRPTSEKDQLARYYAAQEQVQRYQTNRLSMIGPESSGHDSLEPPPSFEDSMRSEPTMSSIGGTSASHAPQLTASNTLSEKEQMRRYHAARDSEALGNIGNAVAGGMSSRSSSVSDNTELNAAGGSGNRLAQANNSPIVVSPRATYAPNFYAAVAGSSAVNTAGPSGVPHISDNASLASDSTAKVRSGSDQTVQPAAAYGVGGVSDEPPTLSLNRLSLQSNGSGTGNNASGFGAGPWAPKVAKQPWEDGTHDNTSDQDIFIDAVNGASPGTHSGNASGAAGNSRLSAAPPLPPKTPISGFRK